MFGLATLLCAVFWQLRSVAPLIHSNLHALIAAVFLYLPTGLLLRRKEDFAPYGLVIRPVGRGLLIFLLGAAIIFPLFAVGTFGYYAVVCRAASRGYPIPSLIRGMCRRFVGTSSWPSLRLPKELGHMALAQLLVVALPEEYFFRGYLQSRLEAWRPSRRRFLGQPVGLSLVVAAALFALGHLLVDFNALRLAVFFPGLVFGWMRQATGSILAGVLFHASSNLVSELVHASLFPVGV